MKAVFPLFLFALAALPLAEAEAQVQATTPQDSTKIPVLSCRAARLTEKVKIDGSHD